MNFWEHRIEQIIHAANAVCSGIADDVERYLEIKAAYDRGETETREFETLFFDLYELDRERRFTDFGAFRTLLAQKRNFPVDEVNRKLHSKYPRVTNLNFASAVRHTIDNDLPITGRYMNEFFDPSAATVTEVTIYKPYYGPPPIRYRGDWAIANYNRLVMWYDFRIDKDLVPLRETFERHFPGVDISAVKKIDFMIRGGDKLRLYRTL